MALFNTKRFTTASSSHQTITLFFLQLFMLLLLVPFVKTTSFKYPRFEPNSKNIYFQGNASIGDGVIDLNSDGKDKSIIYYSIGRALYKDPVHLYDATTGEVADFITHFTFNIIVPKNQTFHGDGLAFFLSPYRFDIPLNVNFSGGYLGLFSDSTKSNISEHPIIAIEFDTYTNGWDPLGDHVGIDINSIKSVVTNNRTSVTQGVTNVWVRYNSSAKKLSVYLTHDDDAVMEGNLILSHDLNLRDILPEWVNIGFSATTGAAYEQHKILSWEFNSTDFSSKVYEPSPSPSPSMVYEPVPSPSPSNKVYEPVSSLSTSPSQVYEPVPSPSPSNKVYEPVPSPSTSPSQVYEPVPSPSPSNKVYEPVPSPSTSTSPSPSPSKVYQPVPSPPPSPTSEGTPPPSPTSPNLTEISPPNSSSSTETGEGPRKANIKLLIGLVVCGSFLLLG